MKKHRSSWYKRKSLSPEAELRFYSLAEYRDFLRGKRRVHLSGWKKSSRQSFKSWKNKRLTQYQIPDGIIRSWFITEYDRHNDWMRETFYRYDYDWSTVFYNQGLPLHYNNQKVFGVMWYGEPILKQFRDADDLSERVLDHFITEALTKFDNTYSYFQFGNVFNIVKHHNRSKTMSCKLVDDTIYFTKHKSSWCNITKCQIIDIDAEINLNAPQTTDKLVTILKSL